MESSGQRPAEPEVPLADAAIATEIARAAARGRGADRAPTLEQLLAAFGESEPTPAARRRVRAALEVAGMGVRPDLLNAEPGQRLLLLPPGSGSGSSRGKALLGLLAVAAILVFAVAAAALVGGDDGGGRASDDLAADPASTVQTTGAATTPTGTGTTPSPVPSTTPTTTPQTDTTATTTTPETDTTATTDTTAATDTATTETTPAETTTTPSAEDAAAIKAKRHKRAVRIRRERAARQRAAAARRLVTVRVDATDRPTFLCVDDGKGKQLFGGTLSGKKTFKARRVRLNVGLASTRITVNGNAVRLDGSPAGLDITRAGGARELPLGQRPCG
jgi:hypothetical protein